MASSLPMCALNVRTINSMHCELSGSHHLYENIPNRNPSNGDFPKYQFRQKIPMASISVSWINLRDILRNGNLKNKHNRHVNHIFSIIGFTETWLKPSNIETFGIAGYNHVGLTRQSGKGGGVALFISDDIVYSEIQELNMVEDHIECIFIKITIRVTRIS